MAFCFAQCLNVPCKQLSPLCSHSGQLGQWRGWRGATPGHTFHDHPLTLLNVPQWHPQPSKAKTVSYLKGVAMEGRAVSFAGAAMHCVSATQAGLHCCHGPEWALQCLQF